MTEGRTFPAAIDALMVVTAALAWCVSFQTMSNSSDGPYYQAFAVEWVGLPVAWMSMLFAVVGLWQTGRWWLAGQHARARLLRLVLASAVLLVGTYRSYSGVTWRSGYMGCSWWQPDPAACSDVGLWAMRNDRREHAAWLLERSCAGGLAVGCWNLAVLGKDTEDGAFERSQRAALQRACRLDEQRACGILVVLASPSDDPAARLTMQQCAMGSLSHCVEHFASEHRDQVPDAAALAKRACEGAVGECTNIPFHLAKSDARHPAILPLAEAACHHGGAVACRNMVYLQIGDNAPVPSHLRHYLDRACELGDQPACNVLMASPEPNSSQSR